MTLIQRDHRILSRRIGPLLISACLLHSAILGVGQAAVTSAITGDGTMGTTVTQTSNAYTISGGTITGSNLFHSFGRLSVGTGDSASFTGPPAIANIVSRVTGGEQSVIDGLLQSKIAGANFYLLNPSGVLFGPNASLDVSGSFHVSTADFLRFADGVKFSAHLGQESVLTVASPTAFGFLGNHPAAITIQGSSLKVSDGQALSAVGGDVQIVGGTLRAPSGRIQLASVASPGEVMFSPVELAPDLQVNSFARLGRLELSQGTLLDASGNGGGSVLFRAGSLLVDESSIFANNLGPVDGSGLGVDLRVAADATITNGSLITTDSIGAGRARDLRLTAGSVHIDDSVVASTAWASGNSGNIALHVGNLTLTHGAAIASDTHGIGHGGEVTVVATESVTIAGQGREGPSGLFGNTFNEGHAGRLFISAPTLTMDGGLIQALADSDSRGNAGSIEVRAGRLLLTGGAQIDSSARSIGRGGEVTVVATDAIALSGEDSEGFPSGIFSLTLGSGDAGRIAVSTSTLTLTDGAQIGGNTEGSGRGSEVMITATDRISISGRSSHNRPSGLFSNTFGLGDAGRLLVSAPILHMDEGLIQAGASSVSRGNAGDIEVRVGSLMLSGGAEISTSTFGAGRGGQLTVLATDMIVIAGRNSLGNRSGLFSITRGSGEGGDVQVAARHVQLRDGGQIAARSTGDGAAGRIRIQAGETFRSEQGGVTTATGGAGGGAISLRAGRLIQLFDSELTTSVQGGGGDAGNISLNAPFIVLDGSQLIANAFEGIGGNIRIEAEVFLADPASLVSASSALGIQGTVAIRAPVTSLSGTLAPLPQAFVSAAALLPARCAARAPGGAYSSLVLGGREGLAPIPGGLLPSPLVLDVRLIGDLPVTGDHSRQTPAARFALLHVADKVFPRLRGGMPQGWPPGLWPGAAPGNSWHTHRSTCM